MLNILLFKTCQKNQNIFTCITYADSGTDQEVYKFLADHEHTGRDSNTHWRTCLDHNLPLVEIHSFFDIRIL